MSKLAYLRSEVDAVEGTIVVMDKKDADWLLSRVEGLVETCNKLVDYGPDGWPCGYSDAERIARAELRKAQE